LQQSQTKLAIGGSNLLGVRRQSAASGIGRIDDHRCAGAGALDGRKTVRYRRAGNVQSVPRSRAYRGRSIAARCLSNSARWSCVKNSWLRIWEKRCKGRGGFVGPDALQIRFAPRRFQHRGRRA